MVAKGLATELEDRIKLNRDPARLVAPVLEEGLAWLEQLFREAGVKALEA